MSQNWLQVPEPKGLGRKRTSSEDNLYLAVLRASEGKKGSGHSSLGRAGVGQEGPSSCRGKRGTGWGGAQTLRV